MLSCTGAAAGPAPLIAHDAWVRATPGVDVAAAYLTLHNGGTRAVVVIGVLGNKGARPGRTALE